VTRKWHQKTSEATPLWRGRASRYLTPVGLASRSKANMKKTSSTFTISVRNFKGRRQFLQKGEPGKAHPHPHKL
jgi:hypothetical protein